MGEYRLSIYAKCQIGFNISYEYGSQLILRVPFITIIISTSKEANGVEILNKYFF